MSEYQERKPTSKGLLARVKCKQRNACLVNRFLYKNSAMLLISLLFSPFPTFWTFLKAAGRKPSSSSAITLPCDSKFRQMALKVIPKGLDYTQIGSLREPCITDLWFWEVVGQSQSWLRTMQTDFCSSISPFPHLWILDCLSKYQTLAHAQKRVCVPLSSLNHMYLPTCLFLRTLKLGIGVL